MFRLREYGEVSSTNDIVKQALDAGEAEGLAVCARSQTAGYGRVRGRRWESPEGGLYLSLLLRPGVAAERLSELSIVSAVAVRDAIAGFACDRAQADAVQIKWPNDIVLMSDVGEGPGSSRMGKLAGISLEARAGGVCLGIGVNLADTARAAALPPDTKYRPACVGDIAACGVHVGRQEVRDAVLTQFERRYRDWHSRGLEAVIDEYRRHDCLAGRLVTVTGRDGSHIVKGRAAGIDAAGHLLATPENAPAHTPPTPLSSGEVSIKLAT